MKRLQKRTLILIRKQTAIHPLMRRRERNRMSLNRRNDLCASSNIVYMLTDDSFINI
jgi:hypothetical protein